MSLLIKIPNKAYPKFGVADMASYRYIKLDLTIQEIRLITILPGSFDSPIWLTINHTSLSPPNNHHSSRKLTMNEIQNSLPNGWDALETVDGRVLFICPDDIPDYTSWTHPDLNIGRDSYDPPRNDQLDVFQPKYEALSYTWGSPDNPQTVHVDDSLSHQPATLLIGQNLACAIRHLRYSDRPRTLWVDAICINQDDPQERGNQVACMGHIYSLASRVIAWLGPRTSNSDLALSTLEFLGRQVEYTRNRRFNPSPSCDQPIWFSSECKLPYNDQTWQALYDLAKRSWFERLWILQEIQLANRDAIMKCGEHEVPWPLLRRAILCLSNKKEGPQSDLRRQLRYSVVICRVLQGMSLNELLLSATGRKCSNARDKIYGILSIAPPNIAKTIRLDYSLEVVDVYKDIFLAHVRSVERLGLLQNCSKQHHSWPSWVPNWSKPIVFNSIINLGFCASGVSSSKATHPSPGGLEVTGVQVMTVSIVDVSKFDNIADIIRYLQRLGIERLKSSHYPTGESILDAYLQTLAVGTLKDRMPRRKDPTLLEWREELIRQASEDRIPERRNSDDRFECSIVDRIAKQALFTTKEGYIGMATNQAQPGDRVFVILGCDMPMLLRPKAGDTFGVIGTCFIHGIMDGEAILGRLPPSWSINVTLDPDGVARPKYFNSTSNTVSREDPRLSGLPLPPGWEPVEWERTREDPIFCQKFKNNVTGEDINSDPRLLPEALTAKGINLETIKLV